MRWQRAADGRRIHLGYCTNVHPGEGLDEVLDGLVAISGPLRRRVVPDAELGVGLYFPARTALELEARPELLDRLRSVLRDNGLYAATANAFPIGGFHAARVKEEVFRPTWAEAERVEHTVRCGRLLAALAPPDVDPCLSTHTGGWRSWGRDAGSCEAHVAGYLAAARALSQQARPVSIALEPEPDSTQESVAEAAAFVRGEMVPALGSNGLDPGAVGLCLDTCHAAVLFESTAAVERSLAGVRVPKIQLSSALELRDPQPASEAVQALASWVEPRWFHQVRGWLPSGEILSSPDLETLLASGPSARWFECTAWRVHFHVPLFAERLGPLTTTRDSLRELFETALDRDWTRIFEVETYTFDRLPEALRGRGEAADLVACLEREMSWACEVLRTRGFEPVGPA